MEEATRTIMDNVKSSPLKRSLVSASMISMTFDIATQFNKLAESMNLFELSDHVRATGILAVPWNSGINFIALFDVYGGK